MGGQLKISTINALRIFNQAFGLIFRRSEDYLHLIPTNEGEGENGDIGSLRPFSINLRSGLVSIGNGLKVGGSVTGNLTGNADTATKIKTARKIGGVAFDGSADINLPGVNATGNQNTTGNAATATKLQAARTINGVSFDGSANITLTPSNIGALALTGGTLSGGLTAAGEVISRSVNGLRIAYGNYGFFIRNDGSNTYFMLTDSGNNLGTYNRLRPLIINNANGAVTIGNGLNVTGGINGSLNGNAATATKLQTARTINGVSFDGSKNIELTAEDLNLQEFINKANNAVQRSGDILSGGLTFENDSILAWIRNTDWAKIGFKNDADSDADSYMWFETGDNGNEYFKWRSKQGTTTKDLMNLKWGALYVLVNAIVNGEVISRSANGLRIAYDDYGFFIRNDGSNTYFMLTNSGDNMGTYNELRPLRINNATGAISMGHGLDVTGDIFANQQVIPGNYGNFDSRYVKDVRLGSQQYYGVNNWQTWNFQCPSGHVLSGINVQDTGSNSADNIAGVYYRPVQKYINGTWYNVASV